MTGPLALLLCVVISVVGGTRVPPVFSRTYTTKGILYIPSDAKVVEPFEAWFDGINHKSRIDYQKGVVQTFQLPGEGQHGTAFKVTRQRSFVFKAKSTCEKLDGTDASPINPQNILPDLKGFQFLEEKMIDGESAEGWQKTGDSQDLFSKYTIWVKYTGNTGAAVPILYEVKRHNKLLNETVDKYSLNFTHYSADLSSSAVFRLPLEKKLCKEVAGGESTKIDMNPMLEFIHDKDSHILEAFTKFKRDFKKNYSSSTEEIRRLSIFKTNYRFILTANRANRLYQLGVNQFTDRSTDEINQMLLPKRKAKMLA